MPRKPGLPSGFKVGTKKEHLEAPAVGGSYLEETLGLSPTAAPAEPEVVEEEENKTEAVDEPGEEKVVQLRPTKPPVQAPVAEPPQESPAPPRTAPVPPRGDDAREEQQVPDEASTPGGGGEEERPRVTRARRATPPRKQINLKPHVIAMAEELLDLVRDESGQKDAASSEMFEGLVLALQEAKPHLVLNSVPPRGAWGSKTARAFPVSLKKQFIRAIGKLYLESYRENE